MKIAGAVLGLIVVALILIGARYTIIASGPGGIWQLDRLTGAVRLCPPQPACRDWIAP